MSNFLELVVDSIEYESNDILLIKLHEKNNRDMSFKAGQFVTVAFDADGEEVRRGYSIWTIPEELPQIGLAIKKFKDGVSTQYLLEGLKEGDIIKSLPPLGVFTIDPKPEDKRTIFMFGAGSGITPLFSQLQSTLIHENQSKIVLFYGSHDEESIIFKNRLDKLVEQYPARLEVVHCLSQPAEDWKGEKGRITKEKAAILLEERNDLVDDNSEYFLCGPEDMMKSITELLKERDVKRSKIHREIYHTQILDEFDEIEEIERNVTLIFRGTRYIIKVHPGESILEKALDMGIDLPNSCQFGNCGTCKAKLLSGKLKLIEQSVLSQDDIKHGFCLTCVGFPASDDVVIEYEEEF